MPVISFNLLWTCIYVGQFASCASPFEMQSCLIAFFFAGRLGQSYSIMFESYTETKINFVIHHFIIFHYYETIRRLLFFQIKINYFHLEETMDSML